MCWTALQQTHTHNVNKTRNLLWTAGGQDEPNIEINSSISTKPTITSQLKPFNIEKTTTYDIRDPILCFKTDNKYLKKKTFVYSDLI